MTLLDPFISKIEDHHDVEICLACLGYIEEGQVYKCPTIFINYVYVSLDMTELLNDCVIDRCAIWYPFVL